MKKAAQRKKLPFSSLPEPASAMRTASPRAFFSISWRGPTRSARISARSIGCSGRDVTWAGLQTILSSSARLPPASAPPAFRSKAIGKLRAAGFPPDFVATAWAQWFGVKTERVLRGSDDAVVLMVGSLAHDVEDAWSNLLSDALRTTPERMTARLAEPVADEGSQSSALQRALFASLGCPDELRNEGDTSDSATMQLLRRIRLMRFDFEATPSRDHDHALRDCQNVLRSGDADEAKSLWSRLVAIADATRAGGSIDLAGLAR